LDILVDHKNGMGWDHLESFETFSGKPEKKLTFPKVRGRLAYYNTLKCGVKQKSFEIAQDQKSECRKKSGRNLQAEELKFRGSTETGGGD